MPNLNNVKQFWNNNQLWSGESGFELGLRVFFKNIDLLLLKTVSQVV
jgi:hypothetical protein